MAILLQLPRTCCLCEGLGKANIRCVEIQDLAEEYQSKTDEELLRLALDPEQLTAEANAVLNDELARRRINGQDNRVRCTVLAPPHADWHLSRGEEACIPLEANDSSGKAPSRLGASVESLGRCLCYASSRDLGI